MNLVGVAGKKRAGKDTVANVLVTDFGYVKCSLGAPLYTALYVLNPIIDPLIPERVQEIVDRVGWEKAKDEHAEIRVFLQRLGTEIGRVMFGENFWVDLLAERIPSDADGIVIPDIRFQNEIDWVHAHGGTVLWVNRPSKRYDDHVSEHSINVTDCDDTLPNFSTLDDFRQLVQSYFTSQVFSAAA